MTKKDEPTEVALAPVTGSVDMQQLLTHAMNQGAEGVAALEKLVGLQERMLDRKSKQAFVEALAAFRANCPQIRKNKKVQFRSAAGNRNIEYDYPELEYIDKQVRPVAEQCGLSYTWESSLSEGGKVITETFVLSHVDGHERRTPFSAPTDTSNKLMSPQQRTANAGTYCMRQSMIRGLGLVACDPDNDGAPPEDLSYIDEEQAANIEALITEVNQDRARLLKWAPADSVETIPANRYAQCVKFLEAKRHQ